MKRAGAAVALALGLGLLATTGVDAVTSSFSQRAEAGPPPVAGSGTGTSAGDRQRAPRADAVEMQLWTLVQFPQQLGGHYVHVSGIVRDAPTTRMFTLVERRIGRRDALARVLVGRPGVLVPPGTPVNVIGFAYSAAGALRRVGPDSGTDLHSTLSAAEWPVIVADSVHAPDGTLLYAGGDE